MKRLIPILFTLSACSVHYAQSDIENIRRTAYNRAVSCLPKNSIPKLRYEDIVWIPVNDLKIPLNRNQAYHPEAYFSPSDSIIWILRPNDTKSWILAHEALHAVGITGHGETFKRCGLLRRY